MTRRKPQKIPSVKYFVLDKAADLRVAQGRKGFERIEYEAITVGFVAVKEPDYETSAGGCKHRAKPPGLFRIGKVQHGVDRVCRMACAQLRLCRWRGA